MPAHSEAGSWIHTAFCSGLHGGENGGEGEGKPHDWEDIVIQTKRAAEWSHLGQQFALGSGFLHAPFHPKLPGVMQLFVYLWRRKKGLSNTKGKKIYRMEGIKGVKLPWCFACLQFCKLGLGMGRCRGCWMERNDCNENVSATWATYAMILLTKVLTATYIHETLFN